MESALEVPNEKTSHQYRLPALIEAMTRPEFYPERPHHVELRQTHISYVFLIDDFVYKVRKPVKFPFLDCSELAQRRHFCLEEVRLNRRLSPDLYLGVFPILPAGDGFAIGLSTEEHDPRAVEHAVEYVVKMRRLPGDRMLDRLVIEGKADKAVIGSLASRLAAFHTDASTAREFSYGTAAAVWRMVLSNIVEAERFVGYTVDARQLAAIGDYCRAFVAAHWGLLDDRVRAGRVREGHGDLRCEHICLEGDRVSIFDCLEFSERLRYCDVASEIAFLAMDLDRLGAPALADQLVGAYGEETGDDTLPLLIPFYKCYRAVVRAKVESLKSMEEEVDRDERERAREAARHYFALAARYAQGAMPALIVVCGPSGTGKSTIARMLRHRMGFAIINSDRVRKQLASIPASARVKEQYGGGIYSDTFTRATYEKMLAEAESTLKDGRGVIIDGTFRNPGDRKMALDLGARLGVPVLFIEAHAHEEVILRRLLERATHPQEVSDATVEIYNRQRTEFVPLQEIPARSYLRVDTTEDPELIAHEAEHALERLWQPE